MKPSLPLLQPVLVIGLAGALLACNGARQPTADIATPNPPVATTTDTAPATDRVRALEAYAWQLASGRDAKGAPLTALQSATYLQLTFKHGQLSVSGGCNRIGGSYVLDGLTLRAGPLRQTEMACADASRMAADAAITAVLASPLRMTLGEIDQPRLTLAAPGGVTLVFAGTATPQTRFGSEGTTMFFEVAPQRVPCSHPLIPNMQCLQVRERTYAENGTIASQGEWQPLYQDIEGYTHTPGTRNVVRLKKFTIAHPPADASSVAYVLDMVVESEAVTR